MLRSVYLVWVQSSCNLARIPLFSGWKDPFASFRCACPSELGTRSPQGLVKYSCASSPAQLLLFLVFQEEGTQYFANTFSRFPSQDRGGIQISRPGPWGGFLSWLSVFQGVPQVWLCNFRMCHRGGPCQNSEMSEKNITLKYVFSLQKMAFPHGCEGRHVW